MFSTLNNILGKILNAVISYIYSFWENLYLFRFSAFQIILDIILVSIIFYFIIKLIKGTRSFQIITGLFILGIIYAVSKAFDLIALNTIFSYLLTITIVAIPVVFQQEFRRGLERLGQTKFLKLKKEIIYEETVKNICEAVSLLIKKKFGALIVFEGKTILQEFIETGIVLNSDVKKDLLINIFTPDAPLHDGAVIIRRNKIIAASVVLPFSLKVEDFTIGTRHKAALGLSETCDAFAIIVSQEKGTIAVAFEGNLIKNISIGRLKILLTSFLTDKK